MKKLLTVILAIVFVVGMACGLVSCKKNESQDVVSPTVVDGKDTLVTGLTKTPDNYDDKTAVFAALGKLNSYDTYKSQSSGTSTAK